MENQRPIHTLKRFLFNIIVTIGTLLVATIASCYFQKLKHGSLNICLFYILSTILTALFTSNYICGGFTALASVFFVNYFFAYPSPKLDFSPRESPLTFCVMLSISLIICTITINLKESIRVLSEREKLLVEAEKEKMRANLLRAVSHDLRTPLTSINGASNTYLENGNSLSEAEKEKLVSHILEDSNWLLDMVENLLSVTRIHNDAAKVTKSLEPIEEVVSEAVFRLKKRLPEASIKVKVPEEFLMIPMDAILIEQVIINLLENAVVHSHSPKPIQCIVSYDKSIVAFHVIDFGIGIAPEKLDTLFDGTTHTSGSSDRSKGMGIGLCICKTIILAHDGSITARNHEQGVEFIFTLPRDEKQVKENTKNPRKEGR